VERGEHDGRGRDAGGEARLAVYHGHLAQRHARTCRGHVLSLAAHALLGNVHRALDNQQHVIAAVFLSYDDLVPLHAVDVHVAGQDGDILARELGEEQRPSDQAKDLVSERRAVANALKLRQPALPGSALDPPLRHVAAPPLVRNRV